MAEDLYVEVVAAHLADLLERSRLGSTLPETLWQAGLAMIVQSTERTKNWAWWRSYPRGELRKVRESLAEALALMRFAAALQDSQNEGERAVIRDARRARAELELPDELARLAEAAVAAVERSERPKGKNFHLAPGYAERRAGPRGAGGASRGPAG